MNLPEYQRQLQQLLMEFFELIDDLLQVLQLGNKDSEDAATEVLLPKIRDYRQKMHELTATMMQQEVEKLDSDAVAFIPELPTYQVKHLREAFKRSQTPRGLRNALGSHVFKAARVTVEAAVPEPMAGNQQIAAAIDDAEPFDVKEMPGKRSMRRNRLKDGKRTIYPLGYARVLSGPKNCAFCIMLASRGPVYSSASHAGKKGTGAISTPWVPTDQWPNSYHDNCDCLVVPVYSNDRDWLGKDAVEPLYEVYRKVTKGKFNLTESDGENEALDAWKAYIKELTEKGELLPVPEIASVEYQSKVQRVIADSYLENIAETVNFEELTQVDTSQIFGSDFKETSWTGKNGQGGHSPDSQEFNKSRLPASWSFNDFRNATVETVRTPDYVQNLRQGVAYSKKIIDAEGNEIWFKTQLSHETGKVLHAYPLVGDNVNETNKRSQEVVATVFQSGKMKGVQRVIYPTDR